MRRPPTDPVNSVLSLLYTFLMNRVYAAVRIAGLGLYPGFLHSPDYGCYSVVLDLMEEFRTIIVDTLTLSLFNLKILQPEDFMVQKPSPGESNKPPDSNQPDVTADPIGLISMSNNDSQHFDFPEQRMDEEPASCGPATGKHPVKLQSEAFQQVIEAFEKKLTATFYIPWRNAISPMVTRLYFRLDNIAKLSKERLTYINRFY